MVTNEMVSVARAAYSKATGCDDTPHVLEGWIDDALRAALEAALSAQDTGAIAGVRVKDLAWSPRNDHPQYEELDHTFHYENDNYR